MTEPKERSALDRRDEEDDVQGFHNAPNYGTQRGLSLTGYPPPPPTVVIILTSVIGGALGIA